LATWIEEASGLSFALWKRLKKTPPIQALSHFFQNATIFRQPMLQVNHQ
jgi:hypothetical protein